MPEPLIALSQVSFEYGAVPGAGLHGVDLVVDPGELVVLCGRSGCGKSTITRVVNGLAPQFYTGRLTGEVRVAGLDVARTPIAQVARSVGSVFQDPRTEFFTGDTISELAFGPENLAWEPARIGRQIDQLTGRLNLTVLLDRNILTLSGGEQQRLACAVATMIDPAVLVLDEPSSTLDGVATAALADAMAAWKDQGKAILVAEHRLDYLAGLADRFVYLDGGVVAHDWHHDDFLALGDDVWQSLGLRSPRRHHLLSVPAAATPEPPANPDQTPSSPPPGQTGLVCAQVRLRRGGRPILTIDQAELPLDTPLALVGANGSGKSSLARWLAGCGPAAHGTVSLFGAPVTFRRRLDTCYLVAQNTNTQLFSETVLGEVRLGRNRVAPALPSAWDGADAAAAEDILRLLDLDHLAGRHPRTLSGGEKQRLVIAVAMASGRRLVILDEPTSGLDATHMRQVAAAIARLHHAGTAVIVVTHDLDLVELTCGAAAVIDQGRIQEAYRLDDAGVGKVRDRLALGAPTA